MVYVDTSESSYGSGWLHLTEIASVTKEITGHRVLEIIKTRENRAMPKR